MPSALAFIGGGLLEGVGKGLVLEGKAKRERARADLEHKRGLERDENRLEGRRGLLSERLNREDVRQEGADKRAGERLNLQLGSRKDISAATNKAASKRSEAEITSREKIAGIAAASRERVATAKASGRDTSAAEERAFKNLLEIHTSTDDKTGDVTTDWNAIAQGLEDKGFDTLAKSVRGRGQGIADLGIRKRAEAFADARVEEETGFFTDIFTGDDTVFKKDGGSRVRFRARMVREFIAQESGKGAPAASAPRAARPIQDDPYVGDKPPPGVPGAKRSKKDGLWYVPDPDRPGKFKRVQRDGGVAP